MSEEKKPPEEEKRKKDSKLSDEELDGVVGGAKNFNSSKSNTSAILRPAKDEKEG